ncbi:MAG: hypothetical protein QOH12_2176 [Solirubrobacteraceae bacterium]|jgi:hypothetical protein|nr:hypothetical protein [Solirubrobacteraceae bacterium]
MTMPPLNRIIAFGGPYISVVAGAIAAWLVAKLDVLGIRGLGENDLAQQLAGALTFLVTSGLSWIGHSRWLDGHHIELAGAGQLQAAALVAEAQQPLALPPPIAAPGAAADPSPAASGAGPTAAADPAAAAPTPRPTPPLDPAAEDERDATTPWSADLPDDGEEFAMPPDQDARITPEVPA